MNLLKSLKHIPRKLYHTEVLDYKARISAAGGTISESSLDYAEKFVQDCQTTSLWTKLSEVGLFLGDQLTGALVKLKSVNLGSLVNHNFVAGNYVERGASGGLLGDGVTKYLETGLNCQSLPANGHFSFYLREDMNGVGGNRGLLGVFNGSDQYLLGALNPAVNVLGRYGEAQAALASQGFTRGFYLSSRTSSTNLELHLNGARIAQNTNLTGTIKPNGDIPLWAWNFADGPTIQSFLPARGSFYSIGQGLTATEAALLYSAVQTLQQNLNRAA
jgi:hypothetical protein